MRSTLAFDWCWSRLTAAMLCGLGLVSPTGLAAPASTWESYVVTIEANRQHYDYLQPWTRRVESVQKNGLVLSTNALLTTAEYLNDLTLARVQKNGRGRWWNADLIWIDYHANLALLQVASPDFWAGLKPVKLADPAPTQGNVRLLRWRNGIFETRKGEINRLTVRRSKISIVESLQMEVDSEITGAGWAEPVVLDSEVVGITSSQNGSSCALVPSAFIRPILEARQQRTYRGLGYFDFVWQKIENPATLRHLQLEGEPRGVLVVDFVRPAQENPLKLRDLILRVDGFDIDNEGDYLDPLYGNLSLENLASRHRWAGDPVSLLVWRDGREIAVEYRLPPAGFQDELVPFANFDQEPEYFLIGGLIFQPLTEPFLRSWGSDWRRKAPFRLAYEEQQRPTRERPAVVVLSLILPDDYNLGYQEFRFMAVEKVNGQTVRYLADLVRAFDSPQDGFHRIEFRSGEAVQRLVLDAASAAAATQRTQQRYGIEKDRALAPARPNR